METFLLIWNTVFFKYWEDNFSYIFFFFFFCFCFLGPHPQHVEVPGLGVKSELELPVYTRTTATQDLSCVCDLYHSQILNPLSEARNQTHVLMDPSLVHYQWTTTATPPYSLLINIYKHNAQFLFFFFKWILWCHFNKFLLFRNSSTKAEKI